MLDGRESKGCVAADALARRLCSINPARRMTIRVPPSVEDIAIARISCFRPLDVVVGNGVPRSVAVLVEEDRVVLLDVGVANTVASGFEVTVVAPMKFLFVVVVLTPGFEIRISGLTRIMLLVLIYK